MEEKMMMMEMTVLSRRPIWTQRTCSGQYGCSYVLMLSPLSSLSTDALCTSTAETSVHRGSADGWQMTQIVDVVEAGAPLLALMLTGYLFARFIPAVFTSQSVFLLNSFVFLIAIPCLIFQALATKDLDELSWRFVLAFMLLRTIFAVFSAIPLWFTHSTDKTGDFLVNLIASTWINTVIFGIPMLESVYGPKVKILNVLAALSSVIFQLPIMLILFEYRVVLRSPSSSPTPPIAANVGTDAAVDTEVAIPISAALTSDEIELQTTKSQDPQSGDIALMNGENSKSQPYSDLDLSFATGLPQTRSYLVAISKHYSIPGPSSSEVSESQTDMPPSESSSTAQETNEQRYAQIRQLQGDTEAEPKRIWLVLKRVAGKLARNHIFIGIVLGLLWSLIFRMGAKEDELPTVINSYVQYFANCVTPVASFCIGGFVYKHERDVLRTWKLALVFLFAKMIVMPAAAMLVCVIIGLDGIEARSAVLLSSLPIALASFALITTYMKDSASTISLISGLIIVGSILMPFVFAAWNEILIAGNVFGDIPSDAQYQP
eukprot:m.92235 g.92235  ORF g.92235 m.92235 type:complete len:546 (+) comp14657_c4_seq2:72-1709(+)